MLFDSAVQQHRYHPLRKNPPRGLHIEWVRVVIVALILIAAPQPTARSNEALQNPPDSLSGAEFSRLIRDVSEEGGWITWLNARDRNIWAARLP